MGSFAMINMFKSNVVIKGGATMWVEISSASKGHILPSKVSVKESMITSLFPTDCWRLAMRANHDKTADTWRDVRGQGCRRGYEMERLPC